MTLRDIMTRDVEVVCPHDTLRDAAIKMRKMGVGMLPVCDGERLTGTISDRDITIRAIAEGRNPQHTSVRDFMTRKVVYCYEDESVANAARIMQSKQVRRIIVLDRQKNLCGIVSLGDLVLETRDRKLAGRTLEAISQRIPVVEEALETDVLGRVLTTIGTVAGVMAVMGGVQLINKRRMERDKEGLARAA